MSETRRIFGLDFGAKLAGTTVLAWLEDGVIHVEGCAKKEDADRWLRMKLKALEVSHLFIDAPLSLPKVYAQPQIEDKDFFYRKADRETKAMSPLFIGGLTARAMRLRAETPDVRFFESYPKMRAHDLELDQLGYKGSKQDLEQCSDPLCVEIGCELYEPLKNWHALDACLALSIGLRWSKGQAASLGEEEEGLIWF